jgi:hypothetical protein
MGSLEVSKSADLKKLTPLLKKTHQFSNLNRLKVKNSSKLSKLKERIENLQSQMNTKQLMRMSLKERQGNRKRSIPQSIKNQ